jgi:D-alanine--poly(phosphoribitol) ligase subunit 1
MVGTLRARLMAVEKAHAARPALRIEGRQWNYQELFTSARALAAQIDLQVPAGLPIGLYCQRDILSLAGILAAVLSGRAYVPLNPGFPADRLAAIISIARPGAVLCSAHTRDLARMLLPRLPADVAFFDDGDFFGRGGGEASDPHDDPTVGNAEPTAYMMFTSGTTGTPKGVRVLERNLLAYLDGIAPIADIGPGDRATHLFDLSFDLSVHDVFVTWMSGAELCVLPKSQSMAIPDFVRDCDITHWFSVPSLAGFCARLGQLTPDGLPSLRTVLFCGEALAVSTMRRFAIAAPAARIWNLYGPTEATIAFTAYEVRRPDQLDDLALVPLGQPIGTEAISTMPLNDTEVSDAVELVLGGRQVTPGYMNNAAQNASRFFEADDGMRWYRTGDMVRISKEHGVQFVGRIDEQVKINGYRVELLEIDAALRIAAETPEVAALPWPVSATGHADQVIGFVVGSDVTHAEIRKRCRDNLPAYMVPRKIVNIEKMPLSASGKVDRKALRMMFEKAEG